MEIRNLLIGVFHDSSLELGFGSHRMQRVWLKLVGRVVRSLGNHTLFQLEEVRTRNLLNHAVNDFGQCGSRIC